MSRIVIGFCGLAGAGKTTAARFMEEEWGFQRMSFAGPLKDMCRNILSLRQTALDLKEVPDPDLCGKSPRQFMQLLGTEFGRELIGPDLWVNLWRREVEREVLVEGHASIVMDDVRFPNEAAAIRDMGGIVIKLERPGAGSATGACHISEQMAFSPDFTIAAKSIEDLHNRLRALNWSM